MENRNLIFFMFSGLVLFGLLLQYFRYRKGAQPERWTQLFDTDREHSELVLATHRGFGKEANPPENSGEAFDLALELGYPALEADVLFSSDGVPFIAHGPDGGLAGRPDLKLAELTISELRNLNFGHYLGSENKATLYSLEEFLERYGHQSILNLELKMWTIFGREFEKRVAEILSPYLQRGAKVFCSSFNPFSLLCMRYYLPEVCLGMLWRDDLKFLADTKILFFFLRPDFLHPYEKWVTPKLMEFAEKKQYRVHAWVVNDSKRYNELAEMGVKMIVTDACRDAQTWEQSRKEKISADRI